MKPGIYDVNKTKYYFTNKQAHIFLNKIKKITKEDVHQCPNIMMLLAESIFTDKPIKYTECFTEKNAGIKYTKTKFK